MPSTSTARRGAARHTQGGGYDAPLVGSAGASWPGGRAEVVRYAPDGRAEARGRFREHRLLLTLEAPADNACATALGDARARAHRLRPGHLLFLPAGQEVRGVTDVRGPLRYLRLHLDPTAAAAAEEHLGRAAGWTFNAGLDFDCPPIVAAGAELAAEVEAPGAAGTLYAQSLAGVILVQLLRHRSDLAPRRFAALAGGGVLAPRRLRRAEEYIEANLARDLPLAEIAAVAGLSELHFARAFRQAAGEPPHRYLVRRRVERAKALLRETDEPVSQIALACGFASHSHLSTWFRRLVGATPSTYRDAAR